MQILRLLSDFHLSKEYTLMHYLYKELYSMYRIWVVKNFLYILNLLQRLDRN